ncbi:leucine-rich repeat-containing protein 74A-like isoform X2 [Ischnura elegans]|uniref:leucine-rich repeat-containing protein 74A-like isoform X2 n=1 Tax=Ischnura elegans TaxID=197161 RepID=UPI001ED8BC6E|nr:leucine-rich repeat-containing protein 74A-like isoform X2 [Ischnura elegans]
MMEEDQESPNGVVESEDGNTLDSEGVEKSTSMEQTSVDKVSETSHNSDSAELIVSPEGSAEKSPTVSQTTDINVDNSETQLQDESLEFIEGSERDDAAPSISADNNISAHEESKEAVEEGSPYYIIPDDPQFPVIHDPGLSTIFSKYEALKQKPPQSDEEKYLEICKISGVAPIESFYKSLAKEDIDLSFYGVDPKGVRAISKTLFYNVDVSKLNLESNYLTCDAMYHLGEMLNVNGALTELNLKGCRIGPRGAEALAEGLHANASLLTLNLTGNALTDEGLKFLILPITEHESLTYVILRDNALTQRSAQRLSKPLEGSSVLQKLDLSWNYLNSTDGCKKLFGGILKSKSIESVNLSWNGLNEYTARHIALCLGRSTTLETLDLSNNRQFILKLGEKPVGRDDFEENLKGAKIKLDNDLSEEIMNAFKIKKKVAVQEMKDEYMKIFPETTLVEEKKKKGKKGKAKKGKKNKK